MHLQEVLRLFLTIAVAFAILASSPMTSGQLSPPEPETSPRALDLRLPTHNLALLDGEHDDFFQYVDRYRDGRRETPWEGGAYGFVRNPREIDGRTVYTRMHEGIDIRPIHRAPDGEPLDSVRAISSGRVVYVNAQSRRSNYGKYVVVEHQWEGSPFYSLYAHLSEVFVEPGAAVQGGAKLGRMGYTGAGINRRRAHLHLEIAMLLNERFQPWYDTYFQQEPNYHSVFSGLNLRGIDVTALFLRHQEDPTLSIKDFLFEQEVAYRITVPNDEGLDLLRRYPWLWSGGEHVDLSTVPSVSIGFTRTSVPVHVTPSRKIVDRPQVVEVVDPTVAEQCATNGLLKKGQEQCTVSRRGERYLELITL